MLDLNVMFSGEARDAAASPCLKVINLLNL